jgi:NarL family two-component system response regulator LiaR
MEPAMNLEQVTRIVLVQAHSLVRQGMVRVLETFEGFRVVGDTGSAEEALRLIGRFDPGVVLIDAELDDGDGIGLVEQIKEIRPQARVVVVSERAPQTQVERALAAGADAYTLKDVSLDEFSNTVRRVADGDTVLHPDAAAALASGIAAAAHGRRTPQQLTPRQREILRLLAMGLENKQIARRLGIGVHTVKTHVSRVLYKLGASSRTEAVVMALRDRLIG